jgi:ribokinase
MYQSISIMTPNITEAQMLSGMEITDDSLLKKAASMLRDKGVATIIITLGARGAAVLHENNFSFITAPVVDPIDTTAAGDVFNGALAVSLAEGKDIHTATEFACRAAAISVTRMGAQSAAPYRHELQ